MMMLHSGSSMLLEGVVLLRFRHLQVVHCVQTVLAGPRVCTGGQAPEGPSRGLNPSEYMPSLIWRVPSIKTCPRVQMGPFGRPYCEIRLSLRTLSLSAWYMRSAPRAKFCRDMAVCPCVTRHDRQAHCIATFLGRCFRQVIDIRTIQFLN